MERWTYLVIAGPDEEPAQLRIMLRAGDDESAWPAAQLGLNGTEVPVDEAPRDYEAPEWQAIQLLDSHMGGGGSSRLDQVKEGLRTRVSS